MCVNRNMLKLLLLLLLTFSTARTPSLGMLQMKTARPSDWLMALSGQGICSVSPPTLNSCRSDRRIGTRFTGLSR